MAAAELPAFVTLRTANLAIVITDLAGFTARTAQLTLEQNQQLLAAHQAVLGPVFRAFRGRVIKSTGDAFLVTFESPTDAVLAGLAAQDEAWRHNRAAPAHARLDVRVGIGAGEVRVEAADVFGEASSSAVALKDLSQAGEVRLTEAVYLVMNRAELGAQPVDGHYRVPRGVQPEAPPYGGTALDKLPGGPTGELSLLTNHALGAARRFRLAPIAMIGGVLLALLSTVFFIARPSQPGLQQAVDEVRAAKADTRSQKIIAAQALIAQQPEAGVRDFWYGKLQAVQDDPQAAAYFRSAIRHGHAPAEAELIRLLEHDKCAVRVQAAETIAELKLTAGRDALILLKEKGGPDDAQKILFLGCNSRQSAAEALQRIDE